MNRMNLNMLRAAPLLATVFLSGCGVDLLAGGQREGEVRSVVTSDEGESSSAASEDRSISHSSIAVTADVVTHLKGTISFQARIELVSEDGSRVTVTNGSVPGSFRIEGADSAEVGRRTAAAQTYTLVRVEFTRVEADVTEGLVVGGSPLLGKVRVDIGSGVPVVVEAPVNLMVRHDGSHEVAVDLNSQSWLVLADPDTRLVSPSEFRSAVAVTAR